MSRGPNAETVIQRPDVIHRLQQFLGLRQLPVVPHLRDGVQAVIIMGDVREVADQKKLSRPCAGSGPMTSEALGVHTAAQLANPPGSGVVIFVEQILIDVYAAQLTYQITGSSLPIAGTMTLRDRQDIRSKPRATLTFDVGVGAYPAPHTMLFPNSDGVQGRMGWTLHPGTSIRIDSVDESGVASRHDCAFLWEETPIGAS